MKEGLGVGGIRIEGYTVQCVSRQISVDVVKALSNRRSRNLNGDFWRLIDNVGLTWHKYGAHNERTTGLTKVNERGEISLSQENADVVSLSE